MNNQDFFIIVIIVILVVIKMYSHSKENFTCPTNPTTKNCKDVFKNSSSSCVRCPSTCKKTLIPNTNYSICGDPKNIILVDKNTSIKKDNIGWNQVLCNTTDTNYKIKESQYDYWCVNLN